MLNLHHSSLLQMHTQITCRLPLGLAAGVNTLVANALGAGQSREASRVFSTGVRSVFSIGVPEVCI